MTIWTRIVSETCNAQIDNGAILYPVEPLTDKQIAALTLAARGLNHREMGRALELSPQTVRHTLTAARRKLAARNTAHAVALALTRHIIQLEEP